MGDAGWEASNLGSLRFQLGVFGLQEGIPPVLWEELMKFAEAAVQSTSDQTGGDDGKYVMRPGGRVGVKGGRDSPLTPSIFLSHPTMV